jgi:hypothetical protein
MAKMCMRLWAMSAKRVGRTASIVLLSVSVWACPERTSIWLDATSTAQQPVFGLGGRRHHPEFKLEQLAVLVVRRCDDDGASGQRPVWQMEGNDSDARGPAPSRILYGRAPAPQYITTIPAQTLSVGCYRAEIGGTAWVRFEIKPNGAILEQQYGY